MEWPRPAGKTARLKGLTNAVDFASIGPSADASDASDEDGDDGDDARSTVSAYPAAPTALRRMAVAGPTHNPCYALEVRLMQTFNIHDPHFEDQYVPYDHLMASGMLLHGRFRERSQREEEVAQARNDAAWEKLIEPRYYGRTSDGVFRSQMQALQEEQQALHESNMACLRDMVEGRPRTRDELFLRFNRWEVQGITRDEGNFLVSNYYKCDTLYRYMLDQFQIFAPPSLARVRLQSRPPPKDEARMAYLFRLWDGKLNRAEQNALAGMYGFGEKPAGACDGEECDKDGPDDGQQDDNKGDGTTGPAPEKVPTTRASRRLAGHPPEFGLLR
ncbi:hypothetical protein SCUCBS95973_008833 [Sporothrix curviconia]|uniref:Uncharacterized protein n=1 Tax=Sporothrix curviconia TaxID=1260050 RepID=A0ABP0CRE8_9PEZI